MKLLCGVFAMTLEEVYKFYGSTEELCKAIGITRQALVYWKEKGYVPLRAQTHIELITKGKLIANKEHFNKFVKKTIPSVFKYNDKKLGLCEVISLHFTKGVPPKIIYISPQNGKKVTVFNEKHLIIKNNKE